MAPAIPGVCRYAQGQCLGWGTQQEHVRSPGPQDLLSHGSALRVRVCSAPAHPHEDALPITHHDPGRP